MSANRRTLSGIALTGLVFLAGCVTLNEQRARLDAAPLCCDSFATLRFQKLTVPQVLTIKLDAASPAFVFESGKSFLAAFEMPVWTSPYEVKIQTKHGSAIGIFSPSIKLLDSEFKTLRTTDARTSAAGNADTIEFFINSVNNSERYMVLFTDALKAEGRADLLATPILVPIGLYSVPIGAMERRVTTPFSPMGEVSLSLKPYAPRSVSTE